VVASEGYLGPSRGHSGWSPAPVGIILRAMTTTAPTSETPSVSSPPRRSWPWTSPATSIFLRSRRDRFLGGVCGGLGDYFAIDPVLFRIGSVVLGVVGGFSLVAYPILWIFVPRDDGTGNPEPLAVWRILGRRDGKPSSFGRAPIVAAALVVALAAVIA
jgi:phage shock protein PspC (stress-responsive transcriptional regulator)